MITLKTLAEATPQQVFDQIVGHLLTQRKRAINETLGCVYRTQDGLKCAAGCLIADDEYTPEMEGKTWTELVYYTNITNKHHDLIKQLQIIHDNDHERNMELFKYGIKKLAIKHNLNYDVLDNYSSVGYWH